jgi:hypothetical protein
VQLLHLVKVMLAVQMEVLQPVHMPQAAVVAQVMLEETQQVPQLQAMVVMV